MTHFYEKAQSHEYIHTTTTDVSFALGKCVHTLLNGLENWVWVWNLIKQQQQDWRERELYYYKGRA